MIWVPGPSRRNDRNFTRDQLRAATARCQRGSVDGLIEQAALAMSCVESLHGDAWDWPQFQRATRAWWALTRSRMQYTPVSTTHELRRQLVEALETVHARVDLADETEAIAEEIGAAP